MLLNSSPLMQLILLGRHRYILTPVALEYILTSDLTGPPLSSLFLHLSYLVSIL